MRPALILIAIPLLLPAQTKPDSAQVKEHLDKARKIAGTEWAMEQNFFCVAPRANSASDPLLEPTRIFDNVYVIGSSGTVAYAITTSDGILLIDSLPANQTESVLLPGLQKAGLDPARIKMVVVAHGHADHFGGSIYLQQHYGAHVVMSAQDWDVVDPPGGPPKGKAPAAAPKRDVVAVEGQPIVLGDEKVTPVLIPGHTPGSMGFIFAVKDGGKTHTAGLFGGTVLTPDRPDMNAFRQYLGSIEHFKAEATKSKVDVELQNHPLMDGITERLAKLKERKPGGPNPFVVGTGNYGKFLDVMAECTRAQIARRSE